uniref:Reverse transcriptase domain-containing protein n=1 Tax=Acrobeloides nanus TaxID=290746 RepID=A0A914DJD4_9BILA
MVMYADDLAYVKPIHDQTDEAAIQNDLDKKSIKRVKKYAAKLIFSAYTALLEQLEWKPISQMVMERRAIYVWNHVNAAYSARQCHALYHCEQTKFKTRPWHGTPYATHLFTVQNSSINKMKLIWNNLRPDEVSHRSFSRFKPLFANQKSTHAWHTSK